MSGEWTRRHFLSRTAGIIGAPLLFASCGRSNGTAKQETPPPPRIANLDEVVEPVLARPPIPNIEPIIRVRVMRLTAPSNVIRIGEKNHWVQVRRVGPAPGIRGLPASLAAADPAAGSGNKGIALTGPLMVTMTKGGWSIIDGNGFHAAMGGEDDRRPVEVRAMDGAGSLLEVVEVADEQSNIARSASNAPQRRQYPGMLRLFARNDQEPGAFDLINDVPLETYLPGVLAGELYSTWQLHTFAAQCVAARSFACTEIAVFTGKRHYDVTNTASSQMYLGNVKSSRAHEATALTRGLVLGYGGLLVSGYYSSCCGGTAASATDVIGSNPINDVEALRGRPEPDVCTAAPVYQWKVEQPIELITRRLIGYGKEKRVKALAEFTRLESLEVIAHNANGRPTRMRLMDNRGTTVEMTAENFRRAANYSGQGLNPPDKPLRSSNLRAVFKRDTVVLEGFGFGHGAGLCQYGAEALAKGGKKYDDILRWYYPGVEIVAAY